MALLRLATNGIVGQEAAGTWPPPESASYCSSRYEIERHHGVGKAAEVAAVQPSISSQISSNAGGEDLWQLTPAHTAQYRMNKIVLIVIRQS
ncbi:hypothetical protein EJB05_28918, partial [Eragrostis curvula]